MNHKLTSRGFQLVEFKDGNNEKCNIQVSSALRDESLIWLGISESRVEYMKEGVQGWQTLDLNSLGNCVTITSRMHLTQSQVRDILPMLQRFAETGELYESE